MYTANTHTTHTRAGATDTQER
eukprot:SAG31_NODE_14663_length_793_cov_2.180115_1_plen_21_part_10